MGRILYADRRRSGLMRSSQRPCGASLRSLGDPRFCTMMSWDGSTGIPFEWTNSSVPSKPPWMRVMQRRHADAASPIRGSTICAATAATNRPPPPHHFLGVFRDRTSVLGDIINSSPTWVGPPSAPYPATWIDALHSTGDPLTETPAAPPSMRCSRRRDGGFRPAPAWCTPAPTTASARLPVGQLR
jgi:hypothetical protein